MNDWRHGKVLVAKGLVLGRMNDICESHGSRMGVTQHGQLILVGCTNHHHPCVGRVVVLRKIGNLITKCCRVDMGHVAIVVGPRRAGRGYALSQQRKRVEKT